MTQAISRALRPLRLAPSFRLLNRPSRHTSPRAYDTRPCLQCVTYTTTTTTTAPGTTTPTASNKPTATPTRTPYIAQNNRSSQIGPSKNWSLRPLDPDPQPAAIPPTSTADVSSSSSSSSALNSSSDSGGVVAETYSNGTPIDWATSFHGLSTTPFTPEIAEILQKPISFDDVEIKPDGIIYLPEIKYRRILNQAFGPGGWGLAPRGDQHVGEKIVSRTFALVAHGRFISEAKGECQYFSVDTVTTALEGCKSNALLRCCKDLGVASELWDPRYIREFKKKYAHEVWVEHVPSKKKRQLWTLKGVDPTYPFKKV